MHRTTWIKLLLVVGLLLPMPVRAQEPCDAGDTLASTTTLSTSPQSYTAVGAGYVLLAADGLYTYNINGGSGQQRSSSIRVGLATGDTITYQLLTATSGTANHCQRAITATPTAAAYPAPVPSPTSDPSQPLPTAPPVNAYPAPTALPTIQPDATFDALSTHGQAVTALGASPAGLAIISVLLLWAGMRMLIWWRRRR